MKTLFSTVHLNIFLHEGRHTTIEIQWLDFVPSADLRASLLEMLRLARQYRVKAWIADNRLLRAMRPTDLDWVGSDIMLPMNALGVRRLAAVESLDAINRMGVNTLLDAIVPNTQMTTQFFPSIEEARAWAT